MPMVCLKIVSNEGFLFAATLIANLLVPNCKLVQQVLLEQLGVNFEIWLYCISADL